MTTADAAPAGTLVTIVEDDPAIAEGLALNLRLQGHRTETVGDAETALARISEAAPALVLLDITLPKQSGLWVLERSAGRTTTCPSSCCRRARTNSTEVGGPASRRRRLVAEPYVSRSCSRGSRACWTRASQPRSGARRGVGAAGGERGRHAAGRRAGGPVRRRHRRSGTPHRLACRCAGRADASRVELLAFLCGSGGRVLSRDELLRKVWGLAHGGQGQTVDNFVAQLRVKLEADPDRPKHLLTVRGSGYRFAP